MNVRSAVREMMKMRMAMAMVMVSMVGMGLVRTREAMPGRRVTRGRTRSESGILMDRPGERPLFIGRKSAMRS